MEKQEFTDMLMAELKAEGLELAEEAAKGAVRAVVRVIPKIVVKTENKYDDLLLAALPLVEPMLLAMAEDINKADNAE